MRCGKTLTVLVLSAFTVMLAGPGCGLESGGDIENDGGTDSDGHNGTDNDLGCVDDCQGGQQFCDGTGYRMCGNFDEDACAEWSPRIDCPSGACVDGQCTEGCIDHCVALTKQCAGGNAYDTCADYNQDGCVEWGGQTNCDTGLICDEGYCVANCTDECQAGQQQCVATGNGYETCGNWDSDSCTEFGNFRNCAAHEVCEGGICVPDCADECDFGQKRCVAGVEAYETCANHDPDICNEWGGQTNCGLDLVCDADTGQCEEASQYPPGPYGTRIGDTIENQCFERCLCTGDNLDGSEEFCFEEFLGAKAILIPISTGW